MQLTLVRHGEASPAVNGNDHKRPLTERGHLQAQQTADFLQQGQLPEIFVVSPLLRAQQTLAHLQAYYPHTPVLICDHIKPDDDAKTAVEWLSQLPFSNIVVVCHMNVVAHIVEQLTLDAYDPFALAEARIFEQSVIANGLSTLKQVFVPTA
ncbi:phosphohistidine phosphatase [Acinetobacter calcoaceticus]|uniref:Phosphohistidine phosphatase n=1 Tax=Acinetobacter calcoaceticus TaxID=471 RepID=A0A4V2QZE1_ACICA|nr:phosphohistidine phosphatase [Acinetobacter calcoaceticus]